MCEAAAEAHGTSDWVPDADSAVDLISSQLGGADTVLVKASRGVGLERVAQRLIELADSSQPAPLVPGGAG
jgi:UDP-N-acetylmuramoyl-tripeptide--D-alanyl-D-alanine ligase